MRAVGITCGIGSMLVGAKKAGFEIVGNVEWRRYYHRVDANGMNTFISNFDGAFMKERVSDLDPKQLERMMNAELALGHPECGNFSQLGGVNKGAREKLLDASDIPLFVDLIGKFKPRFFVMDDLPRSFGAFPMSEYHKRLPDYDLFPELVSNWGYGNVQRHRNRMFMLGSLKSERWAFVPGEVDAPKTLEQFIDDLPEPRVGSNIPNHYPWAPTELAQKSLSLRFIGDRPNWTELAEYARSNWKRGESMTYHANDGTIKKKPGCKIEHWDNHGASVQDGGSYKLHPKFFRPLTIRERARIQGFPDDFIFYGANLNERGEYNWDRNVHMTKQTGKAMPIQFCQYVSQRVAEHIRGEPYDASPRRILRPDENVDRAKRWYCEEVGYADQPRACSNCWLFSSCEIRSRKYSIGQPVQARAARKVDARAEVERNQQIDLPLVQGLEAIKENAGETIAKGEPLVREEKTVQPDPKPSVTGPAAIEGRAPSSRFQPRDESHDLEFDK